MIARVHVWVSGRVQGVYFRYATLDEAVSRGVTGWVCNLPDGRVEAVFEGDAKAVEQMVEFCRRGPPFARVDRVKAVSEDPRGEFYAFAIRH